MDSIFFATSLSIIQIVCNCYRYADIRSTPPIDQQENLLLRSAQLLDGTTSVYFRRSLDTGDAERDVSLAGECVYVLWAWGNTISSEVVSIHTSRGVFGIICFPTADNNCPSESAH